jgi:hypothetical protein
LHVVRDIAMDASKRWVLHVLDGAPIPGSTGACNPSLTIAALADVKADLLLTQIADGF